MIAAAASSPRFSAPSCIGPATTCAAATRCHGNTSSRVPVRRTSSNGSTENNRSLWAKTATWLAGLMSSVSQWIGILGAIVLLALISRLLVLPFSVKAERDQIRSRAAAGELDELKNRLKDDPVRRTRAIRAFYKRHGITPVRNLLALAFLPVMAVALLAVQELAAKSNVGLLWMPDLAMRDPLFILPVVFGVLITLYVDLAFVTKTKHRVVIWLTVLPVMVATGALFGAGANIYLIASAVLLLDAADVGRRAVRSGGECLAPQPVARWGHRSR